MSQKTKRRFNIVIRASFSVAAWSHAAPRIFYSDLDSGPSAGGQNNQGAFVTIYGNGFGGSRGSSFVSVGGGKADNYRIWTNTKIAFQLGSSAKSGEIVVHGDRIGTSNGVPFVVRPGKIYFVATSGKDTNSGGFTSPWRTIVKAKNSIAPGDIAYVMDGVTQNGMDDYNASLAIASSGAPGRPKAPIAHPGARVTIGAVAGPDARARLFSHLRSQ